MSLDLETQLRHYRRNFDSEVPAVDSPERIDEPLVGVGSKPPVRRGWRRRPGLAISTAAALLVVVVIGGVGVISGPVANEPDPTVLPDNGWIAFSAGEDLEQTADADIWLVALDEEPRRIIGTDTDSVDELCPAFSPDGRRLAYGRLDGENAALAVVDVDGDGHPSAPMIIEVGAGLPLPCPVWSPDGSQIAFGAARTPPKDPTRSPAGSEVWIVTLSDSGVTVLPDLLARDLDWSPDGSTLAIVSGVGSPYPDGGDLRHNGRVYLYSPDSGTIGSIPATLGATKMTWSPDGERIAYERIADTTGDSQLELLVVDVETGEQELIDTYVAIHGIGPVWSPDGEWIAYQRRPGGEEGSGENHDVVLVPAGESRDGVEAPEVVIDTLLRPWWVAWSPDSQYLLFRAWARHASTERTGTFDEVLAAVPISGEEALVVATDPGMLVKSGHDNATFVPIQTWGIQPDD